MAIIELATLPDHLESDQMEAIMAAIAEEASEEVDLATEEDGRIIESNIDDDVFVDNGYFHVCYDGSLTQLLETAYR